MKKAIYFSFFFSSTHLSVVAMIFHDFPWGEGTPIAPWDVRLTQNEFNTRIKAVHRLNTGEHTVSFALCSAWDTDRVRTAYESAGWTGKSLRVYVEKLGKLEMTKQQYGLTNDGQDCVVTFKSRQSSAYWNFSQTDPDDRKQTWQEYTEKHKYKDQSGVVVNPSEQPLGIDQRAMQHWSRFAEWIFCDGFGSGTTMVAALRAGRSAVGTEPDQRQFRAATRRLQEFIARAVKEGKKEIREKMAEERLEKKSRKTTQEAQKLKAKLKKRLERKKVLLSPEGETKV